MQEDARTQATEFLKELYAAGDIDAHRFALVRLDATTMIGKIHLRHPRPRELRQRRRPTMNFTVTAGRSVTS